MWLLLVSILTQAPGVGNGFSAGQNSVSGTGWIRKLYREESPMIQKRKLRRRGLGVLAMAVVLVFPSQLDSPFVSFSLFV